MSETTNILNSGKTLWAFIATLFPFRSCLSGPDNFKTLEYIQRHIPDLLIKGIPSGKKVWDWTISKYWHVEQARIFDSQKNIVWDGMQHNLQVASHSSPFSGSISGKKLRDKLHTHPYLYDAIPYRTQYYIENWGLCLAQSDLETWWNPDEIYNVELITHSEERDMPYGELVIPGKSSKEILVSAYICHPSMANDNLSGTALAVALAQYLAFKGKKNWTWRFVWVPETIGALAWAHENQAIWKNIEAGIVMSTCAGQGELSYKAPFQTGHWIESTLLETLNQTGLSFKQHPFDPNGSDERQYSSPRLRLPVCSLHKSKYYDYPEYHSSADDLSFVTPENLQLSFDLHCQWINEIDKQMFPHRNDELAGEIMLGPRDLYNDQGGSFLPESGLTSLDLRLWILFWADGTQSTCQMAQNLKVPLSIVQQEIDLLVKKGILHESLVC